ncbi:MAG TPA: hypothetical protein VM163_07455 [bacterium]|nr:hypothetical protein [bacterium]
MRLDNLYECDFRDLVVPQSRQIRQGQVRSYPYVKFDDVWSSCILVLMQQGIIVRAFKDVGIIVVISAQPACVLVQSSEGGKVAVHVKMIEELVAIRDEYGMHVTDPTGLAGFTDAPSATRSGFRNDNRLVSLLSARERAKMLEEQRMMQEMMLEERRMANHFFDRLSVQLYAGRKWDYLQ